MAEKVEDQASLSAEVILPPASKRPCQWCGDSIPIDAKVCRQCRNFQGAFWYFRLIGVSVPLLTALFYIASSQIIDYNNSVQKEYASIEASYAIPEANKIYVIVRNDLDVPVVYRRSEISCTWGRVGNSVTPLIEESVYMGVVDQRSALGVVPSKADVHSLLTGHPSKDAIMAVAENDDVRCSLFVLAKVNGKDLFDIKYLSSGEANLFFNVEKSR